VVTSTVQVLYLVLLVLSAACFLVAACGCVRHPERIHLIPLGLFFGVMVPLIQHWRGL